MAASTRPPDEACIIHHKMDDLLKKKQFTVSDERAFLLRMGPGTPSLKLPFF
jgi:hypothetical protein